MGEQRGLAPLLTVDLAPVTVELNLRESGARFPCKWSSVLEIYIIAGFELAWKLSIELNHYENEHSVSCRTAMGLGARFVSAREEEK